MSEDKELQVRFQFLEEARDYLNDIESGLLGLSSGEVNSQKINKILRAAHSIKGGGAMMGFEELSQLAHRLEDYLKVLKACKIQVQSQVETLFLSAVDFMSEIINLNRQQINISKEWIEQKVDPVFEQLQTILGEPKIEHDITIFSSEIEEDISILIFETEVDELLQQLEKTLENNDRNNLSQDLLSAVRELSALGEMLELESFSQLCQSIIHQIKQVPDRIEIIAEAALQELRRSQALIIIGQADVLPNSLELNLFENKCNFLNEELCNQELPDSEFLDSLLDSSNLQQETLELFSSLEDITPRQLDEIKVSQNAVGKTTSKDSNNLLKDNTIRVSRKQLEQLGDLFGEVAIERNGLSSKLKNFRNLVNILNQRILTLEQSNFCLKIANNNSEYSAVLELNNPIFLTDASFISPQTNTQTRPNFIANSIPRSITPEYFDILEMDSYSNIHLLSQEVIETVSQIKEVAKDIHINLEETEKNTRQLDRAIKQVQNNITKIRMRPISDLLNRFPRALRDMEIQYGKKVKLDIQGGTTLIERSILEVLKDPLMHLLRNAFDHGIEPPQIRQENNKSQQGKITISAFHRGNQTVITLSDDGGGIDIHKIRAKAITLGIDTEDISQSGDRELLQLIFEPGFSTAKQVTNLSGRGIGMDVVKTNIEAVEGKINLETQLGIGTTFTITVPLTLSVIRVLLVESGGILLAFPTNAVEEMMLLDTALVLESTGQEVLNWEGMMIRLIRLYKWLNLPYNNSRVINRDSPTIGVPTVLVVAHGSDLVGIQIDRYWQEQEVTIRSVEGNIPLPPGFSSCGILGDGRVALVVDTNALLNWIDGDLEDINFPRISPKNFQHNSNFSTVKRQNLKSQSLENLSSLNRDRTLLLEISERPMIMIVDDSINVRRFLALTLEKANYQVEQAKNGQDAIDKITSGIIPQVVICDIEMPHLDGFGFLYRIRSQPQKKDIPVIMLTSRSGDKHRRLAMNLGARDYFTKPFKESQLLTTLEKLIKT